MTTVDGPHAPVTRVADDAKLLLRVVLGVHLDDAETGGDLAGYLDPVAADERDVLDARVAELGCQGLGAGTQMVGHHDDALEPPVHPDQHLRPARAVAVVERPVTVADAVEAVTLEPPAGADRDLPAVHDAADAPTRLLLDPDRRRQRDPARDRPADEALGEDVRRQLVERRREPQCFLLGQRSKRYNPLDLRIPARDGSRLVEQHGLCGAEPLEDAGTLDDHPCARGAGKATDERDRGREDEWARRRHDHHRETPGGVARRRPGEPRDGEREREEDGCVAVREPGEPGAVALCGAHEPDDRRIGAFRRGTGDSHVERVPGVRGARADVLARRGRDGQRLTGERRLVDHRVRAGDDAVRRYDLAGTDDDDVAGNELLDRYLLDPAGAVTMRDARRALDEQVELPAGPARRPGLERSATGHHQGDDRARQLLPEDERTGDGDERDRVDSDVSLREAAERVDGQGNEHDRGANAPDRVRPPRLVEQPENPAGNDRGERDDREHTLSHTCIVPAARDRGRECRPHRLHPALHPLTNGSLERGTEESSP
jgi:hypothetical protein